MNITQDIHARRVSAGNFCTTAKFCIKLSRDYTDTDRNGNEIVVKSGTVITVPTGWYTDFATVPSPFQWFIPKDGLHSPASLVHDYLYDTCTYTRKIADEIFLDALKALGVNDFKAYVMYYSVRFFARDYWTFKETNR